MSYFAAYEPELVRQHKARKLKRKRFWAAGVNDLFAVDQHDKWLRFGLGLHTGIEPFSGRIMWIRVWHSNRNPQLILNYYLDTIAELGREWYAICKYFTDASARYAADHSIRFRVRKLWHCERADTSSPALWPNPARNSATSLDVHEEKRCRDWYFCGLAEAIYATVSKYSLMHNSCQYLSNHSLCEAKLSRATFPRIGHPKQHILARA